MTEVVIWTRKTGISDGMDNKDIHNLHHATDIISVGVMIRSWRVKWAEQIMRSGKMAN
jgi:hypothetical protein